MERLRDAKNTAELRDANAKGTAVSFLCGSRVTVSLLIDPEDNVVASGSVTTNGCGYMVAAADMLVEQVGGRSVAELGGETIGEAFPERRRQCAEVVVEALRRALAENRDRIVSEFKGETALICTCFGVSEDAIEAAIGGGAANTVDEVSAVTRAGLGCGSCRMLIQEMLDEPTDRVRLR